MVVVVVNVVVVVVVGAMDDNVINVIVNICYSSCSYCG